ncbi:uncharacterized protein BDZ99DRAFT_520317 [Mytilinidion resinicola]|uniref:Uncharacterized protein n=1 Tax=Mytilinidion resinicola TaxID=574789 RepID=A0A6A6YQT0_9PEZI|nr:uncharacterized protein BDZ99DRAFT_520317 [Mytilinidion resinicola]KAF2810237.1 hypothetical protein BDZ99DRAFT_520317 [Mytilinidion resinicola]
MPTPSADRIAEIVAGFRPRARAPSPRTLRRQVARTARIEAVLEERRRGGHLQQWHIDWAPCGHEGHRCVVRMDHYCRNAAGEYEFRGSVAVMRCLHCTAWELGLPWEEAAWAIQHSEDWRAAWLLMLPWGVVVPLWGFQ